jgi:protein TonB
MNFQSTARRVALAAALFSSLWLAGCGTRPTAAPGSVPGQLSSAVANPAGSDRPRPRASNAATPRDYRRDAARHVYDINRQRVYVGKLPPLLYAVGTLQVNLDTNGKVLSMHWMRAPTHAPEVVADIERTVLSAAPFPVAAQLGTVTWTDTWLWDEEGHFQLDTLSEGQL